MITAAAIKQAGTTEGPKMREALENLQAPIEGIMKTYNKPFSATEHEALTAADYRWTRWKDGKLVTHTDDVVKALKPTDFTQ
jgi:branched-chain amino acid transport system substrate-binding protein